jgi:hypothetical protein
MHLREHHLWWAEGIFPLHCYGSAQHYTSGVQSGKIQRRERGTTAQNRI